MKSIKLYKPSDLIGKKWRFKCSCTFKLNVVGIARKWEQIGGEYIYTIDVGDKIIKLGSNHGGLMVGRP